jgi:hypothetical protein
VELLGGGLALQRDGEALEVVAAFPRLEGRQGRHEVWRHLPAPELLGIDPMTALDLAILLGLPRADVPELDPRFLYGQGEGERELRPVVTLKLLDGKRERPANLAEEVDARALVEFAIGRSTRKRVQSSIAVYW